MKKLQTDCRQVKRWINENAKGVPQWRRVARVTEGAPRE